VHHWKRHKDPTSYMIHVITYMGEKNQLEPGSMISSDPLKPSSEQKRDIRGSNMSAGPPPGVRIREGQKAQGGTF